MSDSPVRGPFSHPSELGNVFQLMLDTFVEYDTSGDQRLHTRKELSLDNVTAAAIDNYNGESDGRITKFELKKAFRQWPNVTRFLNFAPKVDELWDTKVHNGSMQLVRSTDAGFNIMSDATSILKRLPLGVAMKVAQRLYDFAHDFRYYCSVFKKKNLLEKYHSLLLAMSSEKWLGTTDPEKLKTGIKALEVMHARLKKVRNPEIFLKRFEVVARMGGAKGILLTEKMYQVREKLQDTPVNKGEKVLAILNTDTGAVRYMTIKKKNESKLHIPAPELKIGATMWTKKGGEKRKVAYITKNVAKICPWFIELGKQHLADKFEEARRKLDKLGIKSERFPEKKITEVVDPMMLETFLLIEHIGGKPILAAAEAKDWDKVQRLINGVYFHIGFEGDDAYKDSLSWVGARGIAQFMEGTYERLAEKHPHLKSDYKEGTTDHMNVIMAQYHLADSWLIYARRKLNKIADPVERAKLEKLLKDPFILRQYIAGSYNGGTVGFRWIKAGMKDASFLPKYEETMRYIAKFKVVYSHGLPEERFDMFARLRRRFSFILGKEIKPEEQK